MQLPLEKWGVRRLIKAATTKATKLSRDEVMGPNRLLVAIDFVGSWLLSQRCQT